MRTDGGAGGEAGTAADGTGGPMTAHFRMGTWRLWCGVLGCAVLGLLASAEPAWAEGGSEDPAGLDLSDDERRELAREAFARGRAAYLEGRYQEAIGHWETANDILPNPRLWVFIGQAWANMDNYREAIRHYRLFARSSSEAAEEIGPQLAALEAEARARAVFEATVGVDSGVARSRGNQPVPRAMRRYELGTTMRDVPVQIRSVPSGATVYIDDVSFGPVGTTPLDTRLFTGNHLIVVEREHYQQQRRIVPVAAPRAGESIPRIQFDLQKIQVPARVSVDPITANVTFVGEAGMRQELGIGGWEGTLPAGPGTFIVQQGGRDRRISMVIEAPDDGERVEYTLHLDESRAARSEISLGTLILRAEALDGEVLVNGRVVGRSPGEFRQELTPGTHGVQLRRDGFRSWRRDVEIESGRELTLVTPSSLDRLQLMPTWPGWGMLIVGGGVAGYGAYAMLADDDDDLGTYALIGGGALAVTGIVWVIVANAKRSRAIRQAEVPGNLRLHAGPTRGGAGVVLQGAFR